MALSTATITFNVAQLLGDDVDIRRTRAYVRANVDRLEDTSTGEIRLGDQKLTVATGGDCSWTTWIPGADGNPTSWQETLVIEAALIGQRNRAAYTFGPYTISGTSKTVTNKALTSNVATLTTSTAHGLDVGNSVTVTGVDSTFNGTYTITAVGSATTLSYAKTASNVSSVASTGAVTSPNVKLTSLEEEQAVPATYLTTVTAALQGYVDDAQAAEAAAAADAAAADASAAAANASAALAHDLSGIDTSDGVVAALFADDGSASTGETDARYAPLPKPGKNPLTGMYHASGYGADPTGVANSDAAWTTLMAAVNATGGKVLVDGIFAVSTGVISFAHSNVRLVGVDKGVSRFNFTGTGVGVDYDPAAIRRFCGIDDVFLSCVTAGGTAYRLRNSYRGVNNRCSFESQLGTTGVAVDIAGSASTSTYFNRFNDCDAWGSLNSVVLGDNVNGTVWKGGVLEGPGRAVYSPATTTTNGSNVFVGVGIQCEGTNTSGVIVELGTAGANPAITQSSYCTFAECRFETIASTTVQFHENAWYNTILGGSMAATVSVVDNTTQKLNAVLVNTSGGTWNFGAIPVQTQGAVRGGSIVSDPSSTTEMTLDGGALAATGSNTNQNAIIKSKGAAFLAVNSLSGSGTLGAAVYSGGASPAMRAWLGNTGSYAACLFPGSGEDALRIQKSGETGYRAKFDENGKLLLGDGTAAADTNLYRSAADTLKTDDSLVVGGSLTVTGGLVRSVVTKTASYTLTTADCVVLVNTSSNTTQTLPSAVTAGSGADFTIRNVSTGRVTVAATAGTLNGPTVITGGQTIRWISDGTNWYAVATSGVRNTGLPPWTSDPRGVVSTSTFNANQAVFLRIQNSGAISKIGVHVNVSSGNVDVGIYANNGSDGTAARPGARLASSGSVACPATGYQEISLGSTVYVTEGDWFAFAFDNTTASLYRTGAGGLSSTIANGMSHHQSTAFPLPSSATPSTGAVFSVALVGVA